MRHSLISVAATILLAATQANAHELTLDRATITFDSANWISATAQDKGMAYTGDLQGTIDSESKIFINKNSAGELDAVLIARGSLAGLQGGYMAYSPKCPANGVLFADGNEGFNTTFAQCLRVFSFVNPQGVFTTLAKDQQEILKPYFASWQGLVRPMTAYYANSTGTFVHMLVLVSAKASGIEDPTQPYSRAAQSEQSVAWGKNSCNKSRAA
ncbi:MAG: hypothetical protein HC858_01325 [Brachymonas sp.]|nr:hypothetical protein [Brachymonas sp.]